MTTSIANLSRAEAISRIKAALKKRSGKEWSVTGGKGTAYGWLRIDAPPKRRKFRFEESAEKDYRGMPVYVDVLDESYRFGHMGPEDRKELAGLLGFSEGRDIHHQGHSVPSGHDFYQEYVERAEGLEPTIRGERYWD